MLKTDFDTISSSSGGNNAAIIWFINIIVSPGILSEIAASVGNVSGDIPFGNYALLLGVVLLLVGFGFKISSVPFQMWVPDVYEGGPTPVIAFLSVASKAAAFAILLRVFFSGFFDVSLNWAALIAALAAASNAADFKTKLALEGADPEAVDDVQTAIGPFEIESDERF